MSEEREALWQTIEEGRNEWRILQREGRNDGTMNDYIVRAILAAGWRRSPQPADPRVAEIRARLEAAQGDLQHGYITDSDGRLIEDEGQIFICQDDDAEGEINVDHPEAQAWTAFLFHAPADIAYLLSLIPGGER